MSVSGGMITVPVPANTYQQVVANIQNGDGIQLVGGTAIQLAKLEPNSVSAPATTENPTSKGLTITPVAPSATSTAQQSAQVVKVHISLVVLDAKLPIVFFFQIVTDTGNNAAEMVSSSSGSGTGRKPSTRMTTRAAASSSASTTS